MERKIEQQEGGMALKFECFEDVNETGVMYTGFCSL